MQPIEALAPPLPATLPISRQMLLLVGAGLGLACGFAGLYFSTMAIFLKPMAASLGWTRADVSAATLVSMLGLAVGAPLQGLLSDRWGSRRVIGVSVLLFAAALFSFSWLPNSRLLLGSISFAMGALTVATGPSGYLSVLPRWFDRRLGLALSCAMVGVGLGAMVMPRIAQVLIEAQGWREAYRTLSGIALGGGGLAYFLLSAGELGDRRESLAYRSFSSASEGLPLAAAIGERRFWIIAVLMLIGGAGGLGTAIHLVALLDDRGVTPAQAAGAAALSGVGILLGRLTAGALLDFVRAPVVGAATYLLAGVGTLLVLMNFWHSFALIAVGAVLVGIAIGAEGDFVAFVVRRYFGRKSFASIYGCLLSAYAFGGVLGPVLFGVGFDRFGDYGLVLSLSIAGFMLNVLLSLTLGPYRFTATA